MKLIFIVLLIGAFLFLMIGVVAYFATRKKKKKESKLGIFHHPSNFKKQPTEWVQQPKSFEKDTTIKKL
jgi:hypothetical protein